MISFDDVVAWVREHACDCEQCRRTYPESLLLRALEEVAAHMERCGYPCGLHSCRLCPIYDYLTGLLAEYQKEAQV